VVSNFGVPADVVLTKETKMYPETVLADFRSIAIDLLRESPTNPRRTHSLARRSGSAHCAKQVRDDSEPRRPRGCSPYRFGYSGYSSAQLEADDLLRVTAGRHARAKEVRTMKPAKNGSAKTKEQTSIGRAKSSKGGAA
jgi:hypothetical protein